MGCISWKGLERFDDRTLEFFRGRMPAALVIEQKIARIDSDAKLIDVAGNMAVADDYAHWLLSRTGEVGLEF